MKYINYFILLVCGIYLLGCSNGSARGVDSGAYGNLQTSSLIGLGGTTPGYSIPVSYLQGYVQNGVCPGINESSLVLDSSLGTSNTHFGFDLCNANESYINNNSSLFGSVSNNLNTFIVDNPLGIQSVNMYQIIYNTPGQAYYYSGGTPTNEIVSGLVIVPQGIPATSIKGIVLFYHPTVFAKYDVPSMQDSITQVMLASIYASQGYIVVAPDYIGLGVDSGVMHPYVLYAQTNALDGINMLNATREFLATESAVNGGILSTSQNMNLYISSYSEGGAYALWASRLLQGDNASALTDDNLNLKLTVGISGAYALSTQMIPYAYNNSNNSQLESLNYYNASPGMLESSPFYLSGSKYIESGTQQTISNLAMSYSKSSLASYAFVSFITYNYSAAAYPLFFPNKNFFNMSTCLNLESYITSAVIVSDPSLVSMPCPIQNSLPNLFMNTSYADSDISNTIVSSAMWNTSYFTNDESASVVVNNIYNGGLTNNSVFSFAQSVINDPQIIGTIAQADTWSYTTNTPTSIIYMDYDSTVTNRDSLNACSSGGVYGLSPSKVNCLAVDNTQMYTAQSFEYGGMAVELPLMIDHGQAPYILNLIALSQIEAN